MKRFLLILIFALTLVSAAMAADSDWKLVFEDDFERAELGDKWIHENGMSIADGKLVLVGTVNAKLNYKFKADVRLEFDAKVPDDIAPCDMSATLCGSGIGARSWGYLLGFGARWNHANHLVGPGVNFADLNPKFLIEHGKTYHCVAQKEGKQISYTIDGKTIFDVKTDDPIGGPGFDVAAVLTWTGMDVDNVKAYDRITPHPDSLRSLDAVPNGPLYRDGRKLVIRDGFSTPAMVSAVAAFNSGDMMEALKQFKAMGNNLPGLLGQSYVLGDLAYVEKYKHPEFVTLSNDFEAAAKANPNDKILADYALIARWFSKFVMARNGEAGVSAIRLRAIGTNNNPFYYKARFYQARYHYWNGKEGGNGDIIGEAVGWMDELRALWPENAVLRQYNGEVIPWGEHLNANTAKHPAWAAYLREAYARDIEFMHHFINERQGSKGEFGGGFGDDCEMMRSWMQIAAISSASELARTGIQNLAEGIWNNSLKDGFYNEMSDVEHAAEPGADMLPGMLFIRYGDPFWVERNLRSCKEIKDVYMGIDKLGYPRFKSSVFGGKMIETTTMGGGDSGYCARAMKHFIWESWRGNPETKDWFVRWVDGWRDLTMQQIGTKIPGVVPLNVWYPSGSIYPPVKGAEWWDEKLNYWPQGGMIYDAFLAAYSLTEDPKFLRPYQLGMDMGSRGPLSMPEGPRGSKEWQVKNMLGFSGNMSTEQCKTAVYRWLTGDTAYDDFVMAYGDPANRFKVNGDLDTYMKSFQEAAEGLRGNLDIQTTEVLSTDRCGLPSALSVFGAYTGAQSGMRDAATPSFSITYDTPSTNFAALVTQATKDRLQVWLYNFEDKPMPVGLKLWRLKPGSYTLNQGEQVPGENPKIKRYKWEAAKTVKITHRAEGPTVMVPSGKVWCVDLRLDQPIKVPATAPDMAIGKNDIVKAKDGIKVTVHNIGNADAKPFTVALQTKVNGTWKTVSEQTVTSLPMPKNLSPFTKTVSFKNPGSGEYRISIDPSDKQYELYEANNVLRIN